MGASMTLVGLTRIPLTPFERFAEVLVDPRRRDRAVLLALLCYVALWTAYAVLAKGSQDLHFDMGELIAWSREPAFGYAKHPPFAAWLVKAWFSVFPLTEWAYYLLAVVNATVGLWIAWIVSGRYLDGEKRAAGIALLTLVPFFNFHALKFNANTVLIPLWAATTWWFLRSFETRSIAFAALAGLGAGAAMLGKYWSVTLLAGLALAALADPRRRSYFASAAPWVTVAVGALVLAPHVAWLVTNEFAPFAYAAGHVASASFWSALVSTLGYIGGILGYIAAPIALAAVAARPGVAGISDTLWPSTTDRRLVTVAFWAPLLLPAAVALAASLRIVSLWAMLAMTLLPVVLLSSPWLVISRAALVRLLALAVALPVVAVLAAPAVAIAILRLGPDNGGTSRLLAGAIEQAWRASSDRPLGLMGGEGDTVYRLIPYLSGQPSTVDVIRPDRSPWADASRIAREGIALVCPASAVWCVQAIEARVARGPDARRTEVEVVRRHLGVMGKPERYLVITVPPQP
jgi:4-amino-4-deoxy-L-arabinose transferase-like glycosyltransferase